MKLFHRPLSPTSPRMRSAPPPPTVDVQDFSVPVLEVVPADEGHDNTQQQQRQQQQQQQQPERPTELETNTSLDLEVEPQPPVPSPSSPQPSLVRKLSRGASFKSLFGGGSRAPKSTPALSPSATPKVYPSSPCRSPRDPGSPGDGPGGASAGGGAGGRQYLQVGAPASNFKLPKPQVKLLKKTASVKQLYNSVLHALKTIASARDDITPELTKTFFENILRASDESPKLVVTKVKVHDAKELGRHFCSEVHTVEVTAKVKSSSSSTSSPSGEHELRTYHLVVKSQPQNEDARRFLQPSQTFEKEVQMYAQVFHDMAGFVRKESVISLNCKDSEVIDVPRCFYTRWAGEDNVKEDLIILENLYPQGFMYAVGQDSGLDRRHSELVIRELAKFHAISYCMKQGSNDAMLERYPYLSEDSLYRPSTEGFTKRTITPVMASLAELLKTKREYERHYEWFVDLARNFHTIQMRQVRPRNRFAVICHGDLWFSNILFRYCAAEAGNGSGSGGDGGGDGGGSGDVLVPTEVKFLDFQSARFASLATDLVLFLFTSVSTELRRTMLGELIGLYYTTFLVSVRSLNVSEDMFSMEELLIEIEDHVIYGFLEGIWYLDIVHNGSVPNRVCDEDLQEEEEDYEGEDETRDDDDQDLSDTDEDEDEDANGDGSDEDAHEASELRRAQKRTRRKRRRRRETKEQRRYRKDFFELMDEALFLLGKSDPQTAGRGAGVAGRRSLRDTTMRFHGKHHHHQGSLEASASLDYQQQPSKTDGGGEE